MENSTRQTESFTTKGGHVVVHNTYITAAEYYFITTAQGDMQETNPKPSEAHIEQETTKNCISKIIVSIDGKTENIVEVALTLPFEDFVELRTKVVEVYGGKKKASD